MSTQSDKPRRGSRAEINRRALHNARRKRERAREAGGERKESARWEGWEGEGRRRGLLSVVHVHFRVFASPISSMASPRGRRERREGEQKPE